MRKLYASLLASTLFLSTQTKAQDTDCMQHSRQAVASLENDKIKFERDVKTDTDTSQKEIEEKSKELGGGDLPFEIEVEMAETEFVMGIPEVTMKDQHFALDIVQTKLTDKKIVFDLPGICMKRKKIGQYPEIHGWTLRWKDIIADVPEPCMKRNEIVMGIPEFWVGRTDFVMGIPEFKMVDQKITMSLPQFKFVWKPAAAEEIKAEAQAISDQTKSRIDAKSAEFQSQSKMRLAQGVSGSFECLRTKVKNQRIIALAPLDGTITTFNQAISTLASQNAQTEAQQLRTQVAELIQRRESLVKQFSDVLSNLDIQEKSALNQMGYGQAPVAPGYITLLEDQSIVFERY
ncbi:hypothetical protein [Mesorhizobium sp.]|uniref:hypothetical protein n=1 Tax=Mesorhizobium sp. TaxID=1871066 RepID=UPI00120A1DDA|nr:hypothetical protein [Mesorhizobium sp.]TIM37762.1 MAG: hypothetical protein E5Y56_32450 [Mesorhizobium sp.]